MDKVTPILKNIFFSALATMIFTSCATQPPAKDDSQACRPYQTQSKQSSFTQAEKLYCEARLAQRQEQEQQALDLFRKAAMSEHTASQCFVAALESKTKSATVALDALLKRRPNVGACLMLRAREAVFSGDQEAGILFARRSTEHAGQDPLTWSTLGFAYFRNQDYIEAGKAFEKSVSIDGSIAQNIFNIGYAYYLGGEYVQARPWLMRASAIDSLEDELKARAKKSVDIIDGAIWICPMHPEITGKKGDTCSSCKMDLEPVSRGVGSD